MAKLQNMAKATFLKSYVITAQSNMKSTEELSKIAKYTATILTRVITDQY